MASASEHLALGHTHRRSGNLSAALEEYERALKLAPDSAEAMSLCGLANLHLGKQDLAGPLLQAAVDMQPANVGFMLNLVSYLERAGRIDDALGLLRRAKDLNPDFFLPFARLAGLLETQGAWEEAHENYLQASLRSSMN